MRTGKRNSGSFRGWKLLSVVSLLLWASACAPAAQNWNRAETAKHASVAWTVSRHEVRFEPGSAWLAVAEAARLDAFLAALDPRRPLHVFVSSGAGPEGADAQLAAQRTATAHAALKKYGISARFDPPPAEAGGELPSRPSGADRTVILAGRFEVHIVGCPDWRKPMLDEFSNYESSNFGCANANNLALMVADPEDLLRGREAGPGDGERAARTVRDYRTGALPALDDGASSFLFLPPLAEGGN